MHRDRDADAAVILRERVDLFPRLSGVGRFVKRGAVRSLWRTTTASAKASTESTAGALRCGEDHIRLVERVLDIARAIRVFRPQRVLPCLAAVGGPVDALAVMTGITLRRHDHVIGIFRVDDHLVDLGRLLEADVRPSPAGIDRFVHAVAERTSH